jgi:hypothetical protein
LAAVQIAREKRMEEIERKRKAEEERHAQDGGDDDSTDDNDDDDNNNDDGEAETDDEDDDYGPTPAAGVWAGSQKLQTESDALADNQGHEEEHAPKKQRTH